MLPLPSFSHQVLVVRLRLRRPSKPTRAKLGHLCALPHLKKRLVEVVRIVTEISLISEYILVGQALSRARRALLLGNYTPSSQTICKGNTLPHTSLASIIAIHEPALSDNLPHGEVVPLELGMVARCEGGVTGSPSTPDVGSHNAAPSAVLTG